MAIANVVPLPRNISIEYFAAVVFFFSRYEAGDPPDPEATFTTTPLLTFNYERPKGKNITLVLRLCVERESLGSVRRFLTEHGFLVFELDGRQVVDAQSFFIEAVRVFPQDPPLSSSVNCNSNSNKRSQA